MAPARELVITYGSYSCSPSGHYSFSQTFDTFTLSFSILITDTTESAFVTAYTNAITAFKAPFKNLTVVQGAATVLSLSQSSNTGLEIKSEVVKQESVVDTGRSVLLTIRISGGLPASNATTSGLREFGISVDYSPSRRRTVTLNGTWTAVGGTGARAGYEAGIDDQVSAAKSALGITDWERVGEPRVETSYHDQTCAFAVTYKEILYGQVGSGDDTSIVDQHLRITVGKTSVRFAPGSVAGVRTGAPGETLAGGASARPFISVTANYIAYVDFDVTTDLPSVWSRIRSWIVPLMRTAAGSSQFALTDDSPTYDYDDNQITGTLTGIAVPSGTNTIAREFSLSDSDEKGTVLTPVWNESDPYSKFKYPGSGTKTRTTREMTEVVSGGGGISGAAGSLIGAGFGGSGAGLPGLPGVPSAIFGPGSEQAGNSIYLGNDNVLGYGQQPNRGSAGSGGGPFGLNIGAPGQSSSAPIREEIQEEPFEIGLPDGGAKINITRTTRTTVTEFYNEVT